MTKNTRNILIFAAQLYLGAIILSLIIIVVLS